MPLLRKHARFCSIPRMTTVPMIRALGLSASLIIAACAGDALAQGTFTINGRTKIEGGSLDGTKVVVYKNGEKERVLNSNLSRFTLELEIGHNYILSFEKDGFVTKKLSFDTHAP